MIRSSIPGFGQQTHLPKQSLLHLLLLQEPHHLLIVELEVGIHPRQRGFVRVSVVRK